MKLLRYFNHENIISILDIQKPRSYDTFTEVYLIQVCLIKLQRPCHLEPCGLNAGQVAAVPLEGRYCHWYQRN